MVTRRVYDQEKHVHFVTFSCYKRRQYLNPDRAKRIVIGTMGSELAKRNWLCHHARSRSHIDVVSRGRTTQFIHGRLENPDIPITQESVPERIPKLLAAFRRPIQFGKPDITASISGAVASWKRNWRTGTRIRSVPDWWSDVSTGRGVRLAGTRRENRWERQSNGHREWS